MAQCHAHTRDGKPCEAEAVEGWTVCGKHGAGSPGRPGGRPWVHGAYARTVRPEEAEDWEELRGAGLSLHDELALARLQLARALEKELGDDKERCDGKNCPYMLIDRRLALVSRLALRCAETRLWLREREEEDERITKIVEVVAQYLPDPESRAVMARAMRQTAELPERGER